MLRRRLRLPVAAGASLLIAASIAVTAPTEAAAAPVADDPVQVTIESFSPSTPKPGDPVTITGKVTNKSSTTFENPQAIVCIDRKRLTTPEQLAAIPTEEDKAAGDDSSCAWRKLPSESTAYMPFDAPLAPQASVPFKLVVHWKEWGLTDQAGAYVVGVAFRGNPSDRRSERETAGQARTLMPVISKTAMPRRVRTALVLPLRHRPTLLSDRLFLNDSLAESMAPTGQLGKLLELGKKQLVTWLVDPAMIDEARLIAGSESYKVAAGAGKTAPGNGRAVVKAWLDAFDETRKRNPVVMLPFGDPDVASLAAAGEPTNQLVRDARSLSEGYALGPPQPGNPSGLWLEGDAVSAQTLISGSFGFAGKRGDDVNILSSSGWARDKRPQLQPSPVYNVQTPDGPQKYVRAVIADSDLLAGGPDPATATQPLQLRQRFVAQTSLLAGTGTGAATVVVVPPRSWGDNTQQIATVQQAMATPWTTTIGINEVVDPRPRAVAAPAAPADPPSLGEGQLDKIKDLNTSTKTYQALLGASAEIPLDMKQALVRTTSSQWEAFPEEAQRFVNYQQNAVTGLLKQVHLIRNNTKGDQEAIKVNLSGSKGSFPLTVENKLDVTVRVNLVVTSTGNRNDLRIEPLRVLVLSAGQKGTFLVKASAEQNGLINAKAQLVTAGRVPVGDPQPLVIQAAQYGSVGWILVGAAVALLFGTSIVRIYRRVRSERRNPTEPEPEADALNPAPLPAEDLASEGDDAPATPDTVPDRESLKEGVGTKDG